MDGEAGDRLRTSCLQRMHVCLKVFLLAHVP